MTVQHRRYSSRTLRALLVSTAVVSGLGSGRVVAQVLPTVPVQVPQSGGPTDTAKITSFDNGFGLRVDLQNKNRVIDWATFNVGRSSSNREEVNFTTSGTANLAVLNRVSGLTGPSSIFGSITSKSNITVWLVNPAGITFGNTGSFSGGSLVLSTAQTTFGFDSKFIAGDQPLGLTAPLLGQGGIVLQAGSGTLAAAGPILLVAQTINAGKTITSSGSDVALVAASDVTVPNAFGSPLGIQISKGTTLATAKLTANGAISGASVRLYGANENGKDLTDALLNVTSNAVLTATAVGGKVVIAGGVADGTDMTLEGDANDTAGTAAISHAGRIAFAATDTGSASLLSNGDILGGGSIGTSAREATVATIAGAGAVTLGAISTRDDFTVAAVGNLTLGNVASRAGHVDLSTTTANAAIVTAGLSAASDVTVAAASDATVAGAVKAGMDYIVSGRNVTLGASGANPLQQAAGLVDINASGQLHGADGVRLQSNAGGVADAGDARAVHLRAGGAILFDADSQVLGGTARQSVLGLDAGGAIALGTARARQLGQYGTAAAPVFAEGLSVNGAFATRLLEIGGNINILSGGAMSIGSATSLSGDIVLKTNAGGVAGFGSGESANLVANNAADATASTAARNIQVASAGAVNLGTLIAGKGAGGVDALQIDVQAAATAAVASASTADGGMRLLATGGTATLGTAAINDALGVTAQSAAGTYFDAAVTGKIVVGGNYAVRGRTVTLGGDACSAGNCVQTAAGSFVATANGGALVGKSGYTFQSNRGGAADAGTDRSIDLTAKGGAIAFAGTAILGGTDLQSLLMLNGEASVAADSPTSITLGTVKARAITGADPAVAFTTPVGLTATDILTADTLDLRATAGALHIGAAQSRGGNINLVATGGDITGNATVAAPASAADYAGAKLTATTVGATITAQGLATTSTVKLAAVAAGQGSTVSAGDQISVSGGTIEAPATLVASNGALRLVSSAGEVVVGAGSRARTGAVIDAFTSARIADLTSGGDLSVTARTGDVTGLALVATPAALADYGRSTLTAQGTDARVVVQGLLATSTVQLGALTAGSGTTASVGAGDQISVAGGAIDVTSAVANNGALRLVSSARDIVLGAGSTARLDASVDAFANARLGGLTSSAGRIDVTARGGDISGLALDAGAPDEALLARFGRADLAAATGMTLTAARGVQLGTLSSAAGDLRVNAGSGIAPSPSDGAIDLVATTATTGSFALTAYSGDVGAGVYNGRVRLGTGTAGLDGTINARGTIALGTATTTTTTGRDLALAAGVFDDPLLANSTAAAVTVRGAVTAGATESGAYRVTGTSVDLGAGVEQASGAVGITAYGIGANDGLSGANGLKLIANSGDSAAASAMTLRADGGAGIAFGATSLLSGGGNGQSADIGIVDPLASLTLGTVRARSLQGLDAAHPAFGTLTAPSLVDVTGDVTIAGDVTVLGALAIGSRAGDITTQAITTGAGGDSDRGLRLTALGANAGEITLLGPVLARGDVAVDGHGTIRLGTITADPAAGGAVGAIAITSVAGDVTGLNDALVPLAGFHVGGLTAGAGGARLDTLPDNGVIDSIASAGDVHLAGGDIRLGSATAQGGTIAINASGALTGLAAGAGGVSVGNVSANLVAGTLAGTITVKAGGGAGGAHAVNLQSAQAGSDITITADRIAVAQATATGGTLTLTAGSTLALATGTARAIVIDGGGAAASGAVTSDLDAGLLDTRYGAANLTASSDSGAITVTTGGIAQLGAVTAGTTASAGTFDQIHIDAGALTAQSLVARNGAIVASATRAVAGIGSPLYVGTISAANAVTLTKTLGDAASASDELRVGRIDAGQAGTFGGVTIASDTNTRLGVVSTTGGITAGAKANLTGLRGGASGSDPLDATYGAVDLTTLGDGGAITVTTGGIAQLGAVTAGTTASAGTFDQIHIDAGALAAQSLVARNGAIFASATRAVAGIGSPLYVGAISAANAVTLTKTLGDAASASDELRVGRIDVGQAGTFGDVTIASDTNARLGPIVARGTVTARALADLTGLALTGAANLGNPPQAAFDLLAIQADKAIALGAGRDLQARTLTAGTDIDAVAGGTAWIGGDVTAQAGHYRVTGGTVALGSQGGATQSAAGDVAIRSTAGAIAGGAGLTLVSDSLGSGAADHYLLLDSAGAISFADGLGGDAISTVRAGPTTGATADIGIRLGAGSTLRLGSVYARTIGSASAPVATAPAYTIGATLTTGGAIALRDVHVVGDLAIDNFDAGSVYGVTLDSAISSAGGIALATAGDLHGSPDFVRTVLTASRGIDTQSGGATTLGAVDAGTGARLVTGGDLDVTTLTARGGDAVLRAGGDLRLDTVTANGDGTGATVAAMLANAALVPARHLAAATPGSAGDIVADAGGDITDTARHVARDSIAAFTSARGGVSLRSGATIADKGLIDAATVSAGGTSAGHRDVTVEGRRIVAALAEATGGAVSLSATQAGAAQRDVSVTIGTARAGGNASILAGFGTAGAAGTDNGSVRAGTISAGGAVTLTALDGDVTGLAGSSSGLDGGHARTGIVAGGDIAVATGGLLQAATVSGRTITVAAGDVAQAGVIANNGAIDVSSFAATGALTLTAKAAAASGGYAGDVRLGATVAGQADAAAAATTVGGATAITAAGVRGDVVVARGLTSAGNAAITSNSGNLRLGSVTTGAGSTLTLTALDGDVTGLVGSSNGLDAAHGRVVIGAGGDVTVRTGGVFQAGAVGGGAITVEAGDVAQAGAIANNGAIDVSSFAARGALKLTARAASASGGYSGDIRIGAGAGRQVDTGAAATSVAGTTTLVTSGVRGDIVVASALSGAGDVTLSSVRNVRLTDGGGRSIQSSGGKLVVSAADGAITGLLRSGASGGQIADYGSAVLATTGAGGITLTADRGAVKLGAVSTSNGAIAITAADADLSGLIRAGAATGTSTINIVRGALATGTDLGTLAAGAGGSAQHLALGEAELALLSADTVRIDGLGGAVRIGTLAIASGTGSKALELLGTGTFQLSGTIKDAGAASGRVLQIGGADGDLGAAPLGTAPVAAAIEATVVRGGGGAVVNLPAATLDLRARRITFGDAALIAAIDAATAGLDDAAAAQKVADLYVAQPASRLYTGFGSTGETFLAAKTLAVSYGSYALFQNTGSTAVGAGVVLGDPAASKSVDSLALLLRSVGDAPTNAFGLFGTINGFVGRTAGLLPDAVIDFSDGTGSGRVVRITQANSRVNGCVIGSPDRGCLVLDVPPPTLNLFDERQLQLFGVADDLTIPFDPPIGTSNEALIGDFTTSGGNVADPDCTNPGDARCPAQGTRP